MIDRATVQLILEGIRKKFTFDRKAWQVADWIEENYTLDTIPAPPPLDSSPVTSLMLPTVKPMSLQEWTEVWERDDKT